MILTFLEGAISSHFITVLTNFSVNYYVHIFYKPRVTFKETEKD